MSNAPIETPVASTNTAVRSDSERFIISEAQALSFLQRSRETSYRRLIVEASDGDDRTPAAPVSYDGVAKPDAASPAVPNDSTVVGPRRISLRRSHYYCSVTR